MQKYTKLLVRQKKVLPRRKKCVLLHPISTVRRSEVGGRNFIPHTSNLLLKKGPGGGMVDTVDSKSAARKGVRVQVPPGVQKKR